MLHVNMAREDAKDAVCGLTPQQKLDPAKNQFRASSEEPPPTSVEASAQLTVILAKPMTFKGLWLHKYPRLRFDTV